MSEWLVPSFTSARDDPWRGPDDPDAWRGAIYSMRPGLGPELLLECDHRHPTMRQATRCAEKDLRFAKQVAALADERRPS